MRCSTSSLRAFHAPTTAAPPFNRRQRSFCTVSFSSLGGADELSSSVTTRSSGRKWYNPLRPRPLDVPGPEITRRWIQTHHTLASPERFTIVSYNILGDRNAFYHRDLYADVPYFYLKWGRRKRVICEEIIGWNPDIICLQEVDKYMEISDALAKSGYVGMNKRRTGDSVDGCAMFWKSDTFRLLEGEGIEFKSLGLRDNVAQLSVFEMCKDASRRLVIGNIHVIYNPHRGEVKLGQVRYLALKAHSLSRKWGNAPVLLSGDFNSTPQSGIYKLLSSSELNIKTYDIKELSGQRRCRPSQVLNNKKDVSGPVSLKDGLLKNLWTKEEIKVATGNSECDVVVLPLNLNSSYAEVQGSAETRESNGEPLATSYHSKFLGTVDYIWYSDGIIPTCVLDTVSMDMLMRTGGLPCTKVGSDHLALVSEFGFTVGTSEGNNSALQF